MAKDPAFLMYYQDWLVGTSYMTYEQKGKYIDLLCHQADKQTIPEHIAHSICSTEEDRRVVLDAKFLFEEHYYYNEKMLEITNKRRAYSESRRKNRMNTNKTYEKTSDKSLPHMENENENENESKDQSNIIRATIYRDAFRRFWTVYPKRNGKKVGKTIAWDKFKTMKEMDLDRIIKNAENYGVENEFAKDPVRFLQKDFWKDWDTPQSNKGSGSTKTRKTVLLTDIKDKLPEKKV